MSLPGARTMQAWLAGSLLVIVAVAFACSSGRPTGSGAPGAVRVVAAENFWGSIAAQVGGSHVSVTSIIKDPNADPHDYEPVAQDARAVAVAQYVILNGAGYDPWMDRLIAANPEQGRRVLNVGDYFGVKEGDNPHMWYGPGYVKGFVAKVRDDLISIDPADAAAFDQSAQQYLDSGLEQYNGLIADIKAKYGGTPVGATESIFAYMAPALGLDLITPPGFMKAVSAGTDVSAADEAMVEQQIDQGLIKILVYNSQNTPPNIQILLGKAKAAGIPTAAVTETLMPPTATFQEWQSAELQGIESALRQGTGK